MDGRRSTKMLRPLLPLIPCLVLCAAAILSGCANAGSGREEAGLPYNIHLLDPDKNYTAVGTRLFDYGSDDPAYSVRQGAYFDGKYLYAAAVSHPEGAPETARIMVIDAKGKKKKESGPLPLDHANCITYVPGEGLLVSHCQSDDGHYNRYSIVSLKNLKVTETKDLEHPFFSMAYAPDVGKYASGEWSGEAIDVWDRDLKCVLHRNVEMPATLSQGVFADKEGIYFVRSSQNGYGSELRVYNWECELLRVIPLELEGNIEPESINIVDGKMYVTGNDWGLGVGALFLIEFRD